MRNTQSSVIRVTTNNKFLPSRCSFGRLIRSHSQPDSPIGGRINLMDCGFEWDKQAPMCCQVPDNGLTINRIQPYRTDIHLNATTSVYNLRIRWAPHINLLLANIKRISRIIHARVSLTLLTLATWAHVCRCVCECSELIHETRKREGRGGQEIKGNTTACGTYKAARDSNKITPW